VLWSSEIRPLLLKRYLELLGAVCGGDAEREARRWKAAIVRTHSATSQCVRALVFPMAYRSYDSAQMSAGELSVRLLLRSALA
jgi:hypothetical protein